MNHKIRIYFVILHHESSSATRNLFCGCLLISVSDNKPIFTLLGTQARYFLSLPVPKSQVKSQCLGLFLGAQKCYNLIKVIKSGTHAVLGWVFRQNPNFKKILIFDIFRHVFFPVISFHERQIPKRAIQENSQRVNPFHEGPPDLQYITSAV